MQVQDTVQYHRSITLNAGEVLDTRFLIRALVSMGDHSECEASEIVSNMFDAVESELRPQLAA